MLFMQKMHENLEKKESLEKVGFEKLKCALIACLSLRLKNLQVMNFDALEDELLMQFNVISDKSLFTSHTQDDDLSDVSFVMMSSIHR